MAIKETGRTKEATAAFESYINLQSKSYSDLIKKSEEKFKNEEKFEELLHTQILRFIEEEQKAKAAAIAEGKEYAEKTEQEKAQLMIEWQKKAYEGSVAFQKDALKKQAALKATYNAQQLIESNKKEQEALKAEMAADEERYKTDYELAKGNSTLRRQLTIDYNKKRKKDELAIMELEKSSYEAQKANYEANSKTRLKGEKTFRAALNSFSTKDLGKIRKSFDSAFDFNGKAKEFKEESEELMQLAEKSEQMAQKMREMGDEEAAKKYEEESAKYTKGASYFADQAKTNQLIGSIQSAIVPTIEKDYDEAFSEAEKLLTGVSSTLNARLQGTDKSYKKITDTITSNLSISPYVKVQDVLNAVKEASEKGITYNIEQRAFLNTISKKIAATFDAFDSNLLRLIRLQQADTTAARLGMEANLTKLFNGMFQDTSYLAEGIAKQVSVVLIDANAQMSRNQSAEFEYVVQKWLGALSSLGLSSSTVNTLAQGINYLATGDVTSLASNTQLQTLMAMSISNAGEDYAQILLEGLDANKTNKIFASMVEYLKKIAENSDNQVVRSAYGNIFNMSMSDFRAISNLTSGDISSLSSQTLSYGGMRAETATQMLQVGLRTSIAEMLNNVYNNAIYGVANDMVNNPATYAMTKALNFMEHNNIDIALPFVNVFGSGLDLNDTVVGLMKMGLGVSQGFSLIGNILSGLSNNQSLGLSNDKWNATEFTQRGSGLRSSLSSLVGGTSNSFYVATNNTTDMKNSTINAATDDAEETQKITNKNSRADHTFDDFWEAVIGINSPSVVRVYDPRLMFAMDKSNGNLYVYDNEFEAAFKHSFSTQGALIDNERVKVYNKTSDDLLSKFVELVELFGNTYRIENSLRVGLVGYHLPDSFRLPTKNTDFKFDKDNLRTYDSYSADKIRELKDSFSFDSNVLRVHDINNGIATLSSSLTSSLNSLKPKDAVTLKGVNTSGDSLKVHITNASALQTTLQLSGDKIEIPSSAIKEAIQNAVNSVLVDTTVGNGKAISVNIARASMDNSAGVPVTIRNTGASEVIPVSIESVSATVPGRLNN